MKFSKRLLTSLVVCPVVLALAVFSVGLGTAQAQAGPPPQQDQPPMQGQPMPARLSPSQLQELVAPIALYPDALVAQILAASAYPTQIVEAERFLQQNPNLKGAELASAVDQQDWDPSVKALCEFPSVLADMDKNLSWTSTLGDANMNQQADVMDAVQYMRHQAEQAGNLRTTPQQTVTDQGSNVAIQPANPQIVYVPDYDPEFAYGYPVGLWPGFYPWWGVGGPYLSFGVGFGIGPFFGFGWGWGGWGFDWFHRGLFFGGHPYAFHSRAFYDRGAFSRGNFRGYSAPFARGSNMSRGYAPSIGRGGNATRGSASPAFRGGNGARGSAGPASRGRAPTMGTRSGAFGGVTHGGDARGYSSRGRASVGGGGHVGGGGGHAGGGGHGGHH
ncbi:MAG TPA: DUF3300 domain-containing protein [Candidatus Acidoferrum sp.]|nr:DUF3300 domain-containing protein [Candidatus Acidoferrum sp.]